MFSEIIQICIVIPELILYKSFNILATAHLFKGRPWKSFPLLFAKCCRTVIFKKFF